MKLGAIDLDQNYEYLIVYKDKSDNTINTWTLNESAFKINYKHMKASSNVEFIGIYKKLSDKQLLDLLI